MPVRFMISNLGDAATASAAEGNASYPPANVQDERLSLRWRDDGGASQTAILHFDFTNATALTCVAIAAHTILVETVVKLQYSDNDSDWSDAATLTHSAYTMAAFFASISHRYWRITMAKTAAYVIQVGRVFLGTYIQPTRGLSLEWSRSAQSGSTKRRAKSGAVYADKLNMWWNVSFNLVYEPESTLAALRTALKPLDITDQLFIALDPQVVPSGEFTLCGRMTSQWSETEPMQSFKNISFGFSEDL